MNENQNIHTGRLASIIQWLFYLFNAVGSLLVAFLGNIESESVILIFIVFYSILVCIEIVPFITIGVFQIIGLIKRFRISILLSLGINIFVYLLSCVIILIGILFS